VKFLDILSDSITEVIAVIAIGILYVMRKIILFFLGLWKKDQDEKDEKRIEKHTKPIIDSVSKIEKDISNFRNEVVSSFSENGSIGSRLKHTHHDIKDINGKKDSILVEVLDQMEKINKKLEEQDENK